MAAESIPAVGIDLGTTFSVICRLDEQGQPVTLANAEGDRVTPSVVLFDGDDVVVGKEALKALATEADCVAECSKREIGGRVYHKAFDGKLYPPEVIEAWVLNKLRLDASAQLGPLAKVVITVPAYFDEVRRKATQDAGYMAGLEVLDIINEPTAAAVAFGFQQGLFEGRFSGGSPPRGGNRDVTIQPERRGSRMGAGRNQEAEAARRVPREARLFPHPLADRPRRTAGAKVPAHYPDKTRPENSQALKILVFDLGGGTFDVTVMEIRGRRFTTLATDGDVQLGGYDWDQRLVALAAEAFQREHGLDVREDPSAAAKLWRDCEDAKRTLSFRSKASVPCDYQGRSSRVEITRRQFEGATQDLLDRTRFTTVQTLKAAGLDWDRIDRVLLVGGSTRMPMVRDMLRQASGKEPDARVAADEAVAQGAALRAGLLLAKSGGRPPTFKIKNVNSHSLGVVGVEKETQRRRTGIVIPRNTPLPVAAKRTFKTQKADQRSILVEVVEGESRSPDDCTPIGRFSVASLPRNLPARTPVDVIFGYRQNGRLVVRVSVPGTGAKIESELMRENSLSKEHLDGWRKYISGAEPTDYR
jgi:molecular chaperone DnaK (HSP70)